MKINLGDLFTTPLYHTGDSDWGLLASQRVDFVLCDRDSMRPLAIILFADNALRANQTDCSEKIIQLCAQVGLPLVRLERQSAYFMHQLIPLIENLLSSSSRRDDYTNGDRITAATGSAATTVSVKNNKRGRRQPAYPGYGALRTIANKLV